MVEDRQATPSPARCRRISQPRKRGWPAQANAGHEEGGDLAFARPGLARGRICTRYASRNVSKGVKRGVYPLPWLPPLYLRRCGRRRDVVAWAAQTPLYPYCCCRPTALRTAAEQTAGITSLAASTATNTLPSSLSVKLVGTQAKSPSYIPLVRLARCGWYSLSPRTRRPLAVLHGPHAQFRNCRRQLTEQASAIII
jgi:hypothetical protein